MYSALVIDDNDTTAETHKAVLKELQFSVDICHSPASGINLLKNSPCYDLVLCDLNFPPAKSSRANTEGLTVGQWLQSNEYPTISRVSSAKYSDGDSVVRESLQLFGGSLPPGSEVVEYEKAVCEAKNLKSNRIANSVLKAEPGLAKNSEKSLLAVHSLANSVNASPFSEYIEQGYRVLVVQPEVCNFPVGLPFFVWMKELDEGVFLEVYGQPQLLSFAEDLELSLLALNEVLHSMYVELQEGELSLELQYVKDFLSQVYDSDREYFLKAVED